MVTAYLNVQYLQPIKMLQTVMVAAKSPERKGRKFYCILKLGAKREMS
jgi:hypothetical protein